MQSAGYRVTSVTPTLDKPPEPNLLTVSLCFAQDSPRYRFAEWMNLSIQLPLRAGQELCYAQRMEQ